MIGTQEVMLIVLAAIFLFGGKKVKDWAKSLGEARREFDKASKGETETKTEN